MSISEFFRLFATHSQLFLIYKLILNYIYKRCLRINLQALKEFQYLKIIWLHFGVSFFVLISLIREN